MKKNRKSVVRKTAPAYLAVFVLFAGLSPTRAAVTIDQAPLSVGRAIPPNILYVLDDSGSMQAEYLPERPLRPALNAASSLSCQQSGLQVLDQAHGEYLFPNDGAAIYGATAAPWADTYIADDPASLRAVRMRNSAVNRLYYDPTITYQPWIDEASVATGSVTRYPAATTTSARFNPYPKTATSPKTLNLTATGSFTKRWVVEATDRSGWCVESTATTRDFSPITFYVLKSGRDGNSLADYDRYQYRTDIGSTLYKLDLETSLETVVSTPPWARPDWSLTKEIQNFANWFTYYRSRILAARGGTAEAFVGLDPSFRVGYSLINRTTATGSSFPLIGTTASFSGQTKSDWFASLYSGTGANLSPTAFTPLRKALENAGTYYETSDPWGGISCRASVTMLMTDGYWNSTAQSATYRNADNEAGDLITGVARSGQPAPTYQYKPETPFADATEYTLADVAMGFWKKDLQPNLKNDVPTSVGNPAFWQHMVTMTVGLGVLPTGIKLDGQTYEDSDVARRIFSLTNRSTSQSCQSSTSPVSPPSSVEWPAAAENSLNNIADLLHAAVNGRGTFVSALNPQEFARGITGALNSIRPPRPGSGASLAANSTRLEDGALIFQAEYKRDEAGRWSGDLSAFSVSKSSGVASEIQEWSAAQALEQITPADRKIYFNAPASSPKHQPFLIDNLSTAQRDALETLSRQPGRAADLVDYIRGDRSDELCGDGGAFRQRARILGTIVHSQPVFVGPPKSGTHPGDTYAAFVTSQASRTPVVYVQANDGMLHGFDGDTGAEIYAFIPNSVIINSLGAYADPAVDHRFHLDGEITVADAYDSASGTWRTILVGTLGRAGRGVYALDVTDPTDVKLLWEHDAASLPALGNVLGKPVIGQVASGDWRVFLGNGPNSQADEARLIMISAFNGTVTTTKIGTGTNSALSGAYTWDQDIDGYIDTIYVGTAHDAGGSLWRVTNLTGTAAMSQIFTTQSGQKITATPLVGKNPANNDIWIFFGTGQYLNQGDLSNTVLQSWYGIIDDRKDSGQPPYVKLADLVKRDIVAEATVGNFAVRAISNSTQTDMRNKKGWYINLRPPGTSSTLQGERMVVPNFFQGRALIGTTRIPNAIDPCNLSGSGFVMAIDPFTGARLPRTFFDLNADRIFTQSDMMMIDGKLTPVSGIGFNASPNSPIFIENAMQVSLDDATKQTIATQGGSATAGRTSWREIRVPGE